MAFPGAVMDISWTTLLFTHNSLKKNTKNKQTK